MWNVFSRAQKRRLKLSNMLFPGPDLTVLWFPLFDFHRSWFSSIQHHQHYSRFCQHVNLDSSSKKCIQYILTEATIKNNIIFKKSWIGSHPGVYESPFFSYLLYPFLFLLKNINEKRYENELPLPLLRKFVIRNIFWW